MEIQSSDWLYATPLLAPWHSWRPILSRETREPHPVGLRRDQAPTHPGVPAWQMLWILTLACLQFMCNYLIRHFHLPPRLHTRVCWIDVLYFMPSETILCPFIWGVNITFLYLTGKVIFWILKLTRQLSENSLTDSNSRHFSAISLLFGNSI